MPTSPGPIMVTIRRNADQLVRSLSLDMEWDGDDTWFSEGSASCDCNRTSWFADAGGEDRPPFTGICPGEGAFAILSIRIPDGTVVYEED